MVGKEELLSILSGLGVSDQELPGTVCLACYAIYRQKRITKIHKTSPLICQKFPCFVRQG